jgi:hypothetical protein
MSIEFTLSKKQEFLRDSLQNLTKYVIRPQSLAWDKEHGIPEPFLRQMMALTQGMREEKKSRRRARTRPATSPA